MSTFLIFEIVQNDMLGGGSGEFYHASEDKGREKVERSYWTWEDKPQHSKLPSACGYNHTAYSQVGQASTTAQ